MKKVIYISAIILGLGFVSCQKQELSPAPQEMEAPVWQDTFDGDENARSNERGGSPEDTGVTIDPTGGGTSTGGTLSDDGEITDPNLDPDAG